MKPSPLLASSAARRVASDAVGALAAAGDEDAELVAAEPVARPLRRDRARPGCAPSRAQQHVAGGMAEAVVVGLEAVEVEEREAAVAARPAAAARSRSAHQRAAVAEAGERVGDRLVAHGGEQRAGSRGR